MTLNIRPSSISKHILSFYYLNYKNHFNSSSIKRTIPEKLFWIYLSLIRRESDLALKRCFNNDIPEDTLSGPKKKIFSKWRKGRMKRGNQNIRCLKLGYKDGDTQGYPAYTGKQKILSTPYTISLLRLCSLCSSLPFIYHNYYYSCYESKMP